MFALVGLLATVLLVAPDVVGWALSPVNRLIDSDPAAERFRAASGGLHAGAFLPPAVALRGIVRGIHEDHPLPPPRVARLRRGDAHRREGQRVDLAVRFHRRGRSAFRNAEVRRRLQLVLDDSRLEAAARAEAAEQESIEEPLLEEGGDAPPPGEPPPEPPEIQ